MSDCLPDNGIEKFCAELGLLTPNINGIHLLKKAGINQYNNAYYGLSVQERTVVLKSKQFL